MESKQKRRKQQRKPFVHKPFRCGICWSEFWNPEDLKRHKITHDGSNPFKCSICKKAFPSAKYLNTHIKIHAKKEYKYPCKICGKMFYTPKHVKYHSRRHFQNGFLCGYCDLKFAEKRSLIHHQIRNHNVGNTKNLCMFCEDVFPNSSTFKIHMSSHTKEAPYFCPKCPLEFTCKNNVRRHLKTHDPSREYNNCQLCEKKYLGKGDLKRHMRQKHGGIKAVSTEPLGSSSDEAKRKLPTKRKVRFNLKAAKDSTSSKDEATKKRFNLTTMKPATKFKLGKLKT